MLIDSLRNQFSVAYDDYTRAHKLNGNAAEVVAAKLNELMPLIGLAHEENMHLTEQKIQEYLSSNPPLSSPPESVVKTMEVLSEGLLSHVSLLEVWRDTGLVDESSSICDQERFTRTMSAWRGRYGLSQAALSVASQVPREVICRIEKGAYQNKHNFRTLSNLADFFDLKWRMEPYEGKDYVPAHAIILRWQEMMEQGADFKDVLKQEMETHGIKNQSFAIPLFSREVINRYLNSSSGKPPALSYQASLARIFERLEMKEKYGVGIPDILGSNLDKSQAQPETRCAQVMHQGNCGQTNGIRR